MDFYIGVDQDAQQAAELVREACLTSPYVFLEKPVRVFVKQIILQDYVAMRIRAGGCVFDCRYETAFETDVHLRVARAFASAGILPLAVIHRSLDRGNVFREGRHESAGVHSFRDVGD